MSGNPPLTEVMLQPESHGIGKKCYAIAAVTNETGEFPHKQYFTSNRLRYIGLHTNTKMYDNATRWYFQHPITQEETYIEVDPPFRYLNDHVMSPPEKNGFVEVKCYGNKIRSLEDLTRGTFQTHVKSQNINDQHDFAESLEHQDRNLKDLIYPPSPAKKKVVARGGKRKKTIKKRRKRKSRKNRRKTARR